ncbi:LysE family translocator [Brachybacterium sp. JHP9]|uniref:LysE family translocator n=1 Tax=Brachybacterium equifaecis TaxID=2910770 RepID=A0ABT0R118_9MICO|nr:LysE family translocator [Brachybacterium equifaecis]MCL6423581.1 LysE family translocator [Brachybacterium equifaecis]
MDPTAVAGFAVIAFALIAVPGPDWAFVLAAGARDHVVWPAVGGLMVGYLVLTAVVAVGIGPLIAAIPLAMTLLTVGGALYLLHIGVRTLRSSSHAADAVRPAGPLAASAAGYMRRGAMVSGLNPKSMLLFLAILPQFAHPGQSLPLPAQLAVLGCVYVVLTGLFCVPLGFASHQVLGARPTVARVTTIVSGIAMVLAGIALLAERIIQLAGAR